MTEKKNILIIGGSSYVARHFIANTQDNFNFKVVSRRPTGFVDEIIAPDFSSLQDEIFKNNYALINFAAIVHKRKKIPDEAYQKVNHQLAVTLARKAKQCGIRIFVQISTVAVYGKANPITYDTPENPEDDYARSKLSADNELMAMNDNDFKVLIIRPPMIYGGENAPGNMMRLIKLVDKGLPLPFGGIDNKRDFIHIRNLVIMIKKAILSDVKGIILVSDNQPISTAGLIQIIAKNLNKKPWIIRVPFFMLTLLQKVKPNEYEKLFGSLIIDCRKTFEKLGMLPMYSLEEGIEEMITLFYSRKKR